MIYDGGKKFEEVFERFKSIGSLAEFLKYNESVDFWVICIVIVKLKDNDMWKKLWDYIYEVHRDDESEEFLNSLRNLGIENKAGFLFFMEKMLGDILTGVQVPFDPDNDLSVVFSDKDLEFLFCHCDTLIHSVKDTRLFTKETCRESIYFYRANMENKFYEKIYFNTMMKEVCMSMLDYFDLKKHD